MADHPVVSRDEWIEARKALLEREKAFTRERDRLSDERRRLPWRRVERDYRFDGPDGPRRLGDLFDGRSQLIVYHFMFGPDWGEGCKSCSFLADHFEPAVVHLNQRDVSMVAVSKAPLDRLLAFRRRMGWSFPWFSSRDSGFNEDFGVSFTEAEIAGGEVEYNYRRQPFPSTEAPGASVFFRDMDGTVYHTYSVYQRGLDMFIGAYHWLDIVPKGRDEEGLDFTMSWLRLHDSYGT